jgi:hypothetical protein
MGREARASAWPDDPPAAKLAIVMRTDECLTEITAQAGTRTLIEYHLITGNPPN